MKNKDVYDLTELEFNIRYQVDGCGKKIPKPFYVDILHKKDKIAELFVSTNITKEVMRWLETSPPT